MGKPGWVGCWKDAEWRTQALLKAVHLCSGAVLPTGLYKAWGWEPLSPFQPTGAQGSHVRTSYIWDKKNKQYGEKSDGFRGVSLKGLVGFSKISFQRLQNSTRLILTCQLKLGFEVPGEQYLSNKVPHNAVIINYKMHGIRYK